MKQMISLCKMLGLKKLAFYFWQKDHTQYCNKLEEERKKKHRVLILGSKHELSCKYIPTKALGNIFHYPHEVSDITGNVYMELPTSKEKSIRRKLA